MFTYILLSTIYTTYKNKRKQKKT